jgi:TonB-dependent receptor-like protein
MRIFLFSLLVLGLPVIVLAGTYTGQVTDEMTGEGLPSAAVTSLSGEHTKTDEQGYFTLDCHQPKVLVQMNGFQDKVHKLLPEGNVIALGLKGVYEVQSVKVKARPDDKKVLVSKQHVSKEAIKKTTTSIFPDVARVIQTLPGVTTDSDFSGLLYVRGGDPNEVVALLDQMIIMNPYLWGGRLSAFNPNLVETVDFYAGGYPAEANQGLSALLDIKNKTGDPDKFTGFIDLSAATLNVVVEGPAGLIPGSSFIFGLRRTHYDLIIQAFSDDDLVYPYFYDGQAKVDLPLSDGTLTIQSLFSYEGMNFQLNEAQGVGDDHPEDTHFHYQNKKSNTSVSYDYRLSDTVNILTLLGLNWQDGFYTFSDFYVPFDVKLNQAFMQFRHVWTALPNEHHIFKAGTYVLSGLFEVSVNSMVKTPTPNGYHIDTMERKSTLDWPIFAGFFVQDDIELIAKTLYFSPGINAQYYTANEQWQFCPRLAMKLKVLPDWEWHAATGMFTQHPMDSRLLDKTYGNPDLKAEESIHYILGSKIDFGEDFHIQLEGFYKDYRKLTASDPDPDINYSNNMQGIAYGFDIILQKKLGGNWDGWLTYSYVQSKRKVTEQSNPEDFGMNPSSVPVDEWFTSENDRTHALSLILNYEIAEGWKLALTQKYTTGTTFTPVTGAEYVPVIDEYVPQEGEYNSDRFPAYTTTDIKFTLPFFGLPGWSSYIQVTNLFNVKNIDQYYYNDDYTERKELYQLPRMIIGGFRWDF